MLGLLLQYLWSVPYFTICTRRTCVVRQIFYNIISLLPTKIETQYMFFSEISKQNNDYSDTFDFERGWMSGGGEGGHIFHFGDP